MEYIIFQKLSELKPMADPYPEDWENVEENQVHKFKVRQKWTNRKNCQAMFYESVKNQDHLSQADKDKIMARFRKRQGLK